MKQIKLIKPWKIWSSGHVIENMPDNIATSLISRGVAILAAPKAAMRAGRDYVTRKAGKP